MMKLTVLIDDRSYNEKTLLTEHGLSIFIRDGDHKILFDTGQSDAFLKNASRMGIDLSTLDFIVFSHGHYDHIGGLSYLIRLYSESSGSKPSLIAHPSVFHSRRIGGLEEKGTDLRIEDLEMYFNLQLSRTPLWLTEKLVFISEIERKNNFEAQEPFGTIIEDDTEMDDYLLDDSALVYTSNEGLIIITGCSHSGICNIIEYAKKVCGDNRIRDIIGGFHLINTTEMQLKETLKSLRLKNPVVIHPCHCTGQNSINVISEEVNTEEIGVGFTVEYI